MKIGRRRIENHSMPIIVILYCLLRCAAVSAEGVGSFEVAKTLSTAGKCKNICMISSSQLDKIPDKQPFITLIRTNNEIFIPDVSPVYRTTKKGNEYSINPQYSTRINDFPFALIFPSEDQASIVRDLYTKAMRKRGDANARVLFCPEGNTIRVMVNQSSCTDIWADNKTVGDDLSGTGVAASIPIQEFKQELEDPSFEATKREQGDETKIVNTQNKDSMQEQLIQSVSSVSVQLVEQRKDIGAITKSLGTVQSTINTIEKALETIQIPVYGIKLPFWSYFLFGFLYIIPIALLTLLLRYERRRSDNLNGQLDLISKNYQNGLESIQSEFNLLHMKFMRVYGIATGISELLLSEIELDSQAEEASLRILNNGLLTEIDFVESRFEAAEKHLQVSPAVERIRAELAELCAMFVEAGATHKKALSRLRVDHKDIDLSDIVAQILKRQLPPVHIQLETIAVGESPVEPRDVRSADTTPVLSNDERPYNKPPDKKADDRVNAAGRGIVMEHRESPKITPTSVLAPPPDLRPGGSSSRSVDAGREQRLRSARSQILDAAFEEVKNYIDRCCSVYDLPMPLDLLESRFHAARSAVGDPSIFYEALKEFINFSFGAAVKESELLTILDRPNGLCKVFSLEIGLQQKVLSDRAHGVKRYSFPQGNAGLNDIIVKTASCNRMQFPPGTLDSESIVKFVKPYINLIKLKTTQDMIVLTYHDLDQKLAELK